MIEATGDIARHFDVLNLIFAYRHLMSIKHQNIGRH